MKYRYELLLSLLVFSCTQVQQEEKYVLPSEREINDVIQAVVVQDSLFYGEWSNIPLSVDLYKLEIYFPDTANYGREIPPLPWINNFYKLVGVRGENAPFTVQDSSFLLYQIQKSHGAVLDSGNYKNISFTSWKEQEPKLKAYEKTAFYYFSKPLFNNDQSKAYVELMFICRKLCGYGNGFVLEKRNGSWEIVHKDVKWYE